MMKCFAALALAACALMANAGPLTGQTLGVSGGYKPLTPGSALVGAGVEFTEVNIVTSTIQNDILFDFDEDGLVKVSLLLGAGATALNHTAVDIPVFSDLNGTIAEIIGFDLLSLSGVTGLQASNLSFTDNSVTMSIGSGTQWARDSFFTAQIRFADPVQVPEPESLALVGMGLLAAAAARRRARAAG